jgi:glycosyltransferase involved in cell wall biosynthesis
MASLPEVTVVVPTHSRWDLLSTAALPSSLRQEEVDVEVVVVDDGSTDSTAERLAAIGDPRVRVVRHDRPRGVAQARNAGIAAARGEWIALLDDDDLWAPRKLRAQLDAAAAEGAGFAYGGAAALGEDRTWVYSLAPPDPKTLTSVLLERNVLWGGCSNVLVRSDIVRQLGGFDEQLFQLTDWDLWIRLSQTCPAAACSQVLVGCIEHQRSMLLTSEDDVFDEFDYVEEKHRAAREAAGVRIDRRVFSRWVALGHRRAGRRFRAARIYADAIVRNRDPGSLARAIVAPLGERPVEWMRRLRKTTPRVDSLDGLGEPPWLALYR